MITKIVSFLQAAEYLNFLERTKFCSGAEAENKETFSILNLNLRSTKLDVLVNIIQYKK